MWIPNQEDLNKLLTLLSNSLSADNRIQQEVFETLKKFEDRPDFYCYLLFIIRQLRHQLDNTIITTALTIFKNNISNIYKFLELEMQNEIKNLTLELISSENDKFRSFAGNILAVIANGNFSHVHEILPKIAQMINSGESGVNISYFRALEKICEDLTQFSSNSGPDSSVCVMSRFLITFLSLNQNDYRNHWVLVCLNILLPINSEFILAPDFHVIDIACVLIVYDDCSTSSAISFLTTLNDISIKDIESNFFNVSTSLANFLLSESYNRAFITAEFWNTFFDHYLSKDLARPLLGTLIKNLIKTMSFTENDHLYSKLKNNEEDEDEDIDPSRISEGEMDETTLETESWTLRKSSALTLDRIAQIYQREIFPYLVFLVDLLHDSDWTKQESAILAFGAISRGCESFFHEFFPNVFTILIKFLDHEYILIRSITCWTLSRYSEFFNDAQPIYFQQTVMKTLELMSDKSLTVQSSAIFALTSYIDTCGDIMSCFCQNVSQKILYSLKTSKGKIVRELYEFIGRSAKYLPNLSSNSIFIDKIIPEILDRLVINHDEFKVLDILLMDLLCNLTSASGMILLPYAMNIMRYCTLNIKQTLNQIFASSETIDICFPDLDYMIASLDLIGAFICNYEMKTCQYIQNLELISLLIYCCQVQDTSVKDSSFCCLDYICQNCPDILLPEIDKIMALISSCDVKKSPSSLWLCDKIISNIKHKTNQYFEIIFSIIYDLISVEGYCRTKKFKKVLVSVIYQLSSFCPHQIRPHANKIIFFLINNISTSRDVQLIYNGFYALFNLLTDNPEIFKNNIIRIYDLFVSYNDMDQYLCSIFINMISSNKIKIPPHEWIEIHQRIPPTVQIKLQSLCGL